MTFKKGHGFIGGGKKKGCIAWNKGKRCPDVSERNKILHKGNKYNLGKHWKLSLQSKINISNGHKGSKGGGWKGGINPINDTIRKSIQYRLWRESVFARDNWTCQKTKIKGCRIEPHHIRNFSQYPELRFAIDNGITLSKEEHRRFHKKYGVENNTIDQINEFLNDSEYVVEVRKT